MIRKFEIVLAAEAAENIEQAYLWIASDDQAAGEKWYEGLIGELQGLCESPLRCPVSPETRLGLVDREIRQLLYGHGYWKYRVLFAVENQTVQILHVRHGARLYIGQEPPQNE